MSFPSNEMKNERAESALDLIQNLDQSLQKINHEIALAKMEFDGARRNAEYAKRIHRIYSSSDASPVHSPSRTYRLNSDVHVLTPASSLHQISPLTKSSAQDTQRIINQSLELEREEHAQTKAKLEKSIQNEVELQQVIHFMEAKLNQLQERILAAERDAESALDLAKSNELYCQQLEISLEQCQLEKSYLETELNKRIGPVGTDRSRIKTCVQVNRSIPSPSPNNTSEISVNRAMVTCGREILQKRRQGRGITSPIIHHLPPTDIDSEKNTIGESLDV